MLRRKLINLLFLLALGCGAQKTPQPAAPEQPSTQISLEWTKHYAGPPESVELSDEENTLAKEVAKRVLVNCAFDGRLFRAAREYAEVITSASLSPRNEDLDRLRHTIIKNGIADYALQPIVARFDEAGLGSLFELIGQNRLNISHCGFGVAGDDSRRRIVWIGVERFVDLAPFPSRLEAGEKVRLQGRVLRNFGTYVEPFIGHPNGTVTRLPKVPTSSIGGFEVIIRLTEPGRSEIELLVDRGRGPETAVLAPIYVSRDPDPRPVVVVEANNSNGSKSPDDVLFDYLEASRNRLGLKPLIKDSRLDEVAMAHSEDMVESGFFGHVSPSQGALDSRLTSAGLSPSRSAENIARSSSPLRIHRNLMGSPSHRINVLHPDFTHVGVGIVRDEGELVATEVFAQF